MAAELKVQAAPTLLYEPRRPAQIGHGARPGWQRCVSHSNGYAEFGWERAPEHDAQGAVVQQIVARYLLTTVLRRDLASEYGFSERVIQGYLHGENYASYSAPVLAALKRLGIGHKRGFWGEGRDSRALEIIHAYASVARRVLAGGLTDRVRSDLRLLAIAGETPA